MWADGGHAVRISEIAMKIFLFVAIYLMIASPLIAEEGKGAEFLRQGTAYFEAQDYPMAVEAFKHAARLSPKSADAHKGLGMAYLKMGSSETSTNP